MQSLVEEGEGAVFYKGKLYWHLNWRHHSRAQLPSYGQGICSPLKLGCWEDSCLLSLGVHVCRGVCTHPLSWNMFIGLRFRLETGTEPFSVRFWRVRDRTRSFSTNAAVISNQRAERVPTSMKPKELRRERTGKSKRGYKRVSNVRMRKIGEAWGEPRGSCLG